MAGVRELKKHLKSIKSIGQLAGAMKTVSTAKYSRINALNTDYAEYARECGRILERFGTEASFPERPEETAGRICLVVMCGNRGLCGSYNSDTMARFAQILGQETGALVVTCGRMAALYCHDKRIPTEREFMFEDIPSFADAQQLSQYLCGLYRSGEADKIIIVRQKFKNMLTQIPTDEVFLPGGSAAEEDGGILYLPDRETIVRRVIFECLDAKIYSLLLECAAGAQAATLMAMRSAFDNSKTTASELETKINRIRQGEVTADVIEISYDRSEEEDFASGGQSAE